MYRLGIRCQPTNHKPTIKPPQNSHKATKSECVTLQDTTTRINTYETAAHFQIHEGSSRGVITQNCTFLLNNNHSYLQQVSSSRKNSYRPPFDLTPTKQYKTNFMIQTIRLGFHSVCNLTKWGEIKSVVPHFVGFCSVKAILMD